MEIHHVHWKSTGGSDDLDNAIPLCFECHAEVNHYNPKHPKGRKFTDEELTEHRKQWLAICKEHPEALISAPRNSDIGPLEGMLQELDFNNSVTSRMTDGSSSWQGNIGSPLHDKEYTRAVEQGSMFLLTDDLRKAIMDAYSRVGQVNTFTRMYSNTRPEGNAFAEATNRLLAAFRIGHTDIQLAHSKLKDFLSPKGG